MGCGRWFFKRKVLFNLKVFQNFNSNSESVYNCLPGKLEVSLVVQLFHCDVEKRSNANTEVRGDIIIMMIIKMCVENNTYVTIS